MNVYYIVIIIVRCLEFYVLENNLKTRRSLRAHSKMVCELWLCRYIHVWCVGVSKVLYFINMSKLMHSIKFDSPMHHLKHLTLVHCGNYSCSLNKHTSINSLVLYACWYHILSTNALKGTLTITHNIIFFSLQYGLIMLMLVLNNTLVLELWRQISQGQ